MINGWQGNSGRVQRLPEQSDRPKAHPRPAPVVSENSSPPRRPTPIPTPPRKAGAIFSGLEGLKKLIPGKAEELETEDIILLLILYLMYRESGDSELLMIMGAMFLL